MYRSDAALTDSTTPKTCHPALKVAPTDGSSTYTTSERRLLGVVGDADYGLAPLHPHPLMGFRVLEIGRNVAHFTSLLARSFTIRTCAMNSLTPTTPTRDVSDLRGRRLADPLLAQGEPADHHRRVGQHHLVAGTSSSFGRSAGALPSRGRAKMERAVPSGQRLGPPGQGRSGPFDQRAARDHAGIVAAGADHRVAARTARMPFSFIWKRTICRCRCWAAATMVGRPTKKGLCSLTKAP